MLANPQAITALLIALVALVLLIRGKAAPDFVSLCVLAALGITQLVDLTTLFSGFGNPVILTIVGMFMMTAALDATGVTAIVSRRLLSLIATAPKVVVIGLVALSAAFASLLMNTFASVALVAPIARRVAHERNLSPSQVLMPVAYGALLGGMATLLTTSNLVLADMLTSHGLPTFGLFSFLPVGGPIALVGIVYIAMVAPRLLTHRAPADQWTDLQEARTQLPKTYALNQRLFDAYVSAESPLVDTLLGESKLGERYGANVAAIIRGKKVLAPPSPRTRIHALDWLLIGARREDAEKAGAELAIDVSEHRPDQNDFLYANEAELAEIALPPHSAIVGKTLADLNFRERFGVNVLAIWREGRPWRSHLTDYTLRSGDGLLVHGTPDRLSQLGRDNGFLVLTRLPDLPAASSKALLSTGILIAFLIVVGLRWMPVSVAALAAAVLVVATGCISIDQARANIRWPIIFLIGGMLPLATALENAGVFTSLANWLPSAFDLLGMRVTLFALVMITALITQLVSNTAATLIVGPLAITSAIQAHLNPEAVAMAVAVGASSAFLSPIAHPANLLVMSVGGYRFSDYARLGLGLLIIAGLGAAILIPLVFPI